MLPKAGNAGQSQLASMWNCLGHIESSDTFLENETNAGSGHVVVSLKGVPKLAIEQGAVGGRGSGRLCCRLGGSPALLRHKLPHGALDGLQLCVQHRVRRFPPAYPVATGVNPCTWPSQLIQARAFPGCAATDSKTAWTDEVFCSAAKVTQPRCADKR